jgi:IclR family mhp operon transcriptional activator
MTDKKHLSSLKRGLRALHFMNYAGRMTAAELAREIKVPRTTAYRILETLVSEGYVAHDPIGHSFYLVSRVRQLAYGFNRDDLVSEAARPILHDLCQKVLMPVGLTTPVGTDMVIQVSMDHEAPLALVRLPEGTAFPITYGPTGHLFLAHCSEELRRRVIALSLTHPSVASQRLPPGDTPSDDYLDSLRRKKFAVGLGVGSQTVEGLIAVPVYFKGIYAASLYMRFMKKVLSPEVVIARHLPDLTAAAAAIESRLGHMAKEAPGLYEGINSLVSLSQPDPPTSSVAH